MNCRRSFTIERCQRRETLAFNTRRSSKTWRWDRIILVIFMFMSTRRPRKRCAALIIFIVSISFFFFLCKLYIWQYCLLWTAAVAHYVNEWEHRSFSRVSMRYLCPTAFCTTDHWTQAEAAALVLFANFRSLSPPKKGSKVWKEI